MPLSFQYTSSGTAPALSVTITAPANGASFQLGAKVSIAVSTGGNPTNLQLRVDGLNVGSPVLVGPLALDTTGLQLGSHVLTVVASKGSNTAVSVPITINIVAVTTTTPFITAQVSSALRNNYTGFVGMQIQVGSKPLVVTSLGRLYSTGNSGTHTLKLVQSNGVDLPGGSVSLAMSSGTTGQYSYASLPSAVTLQASTTYYLVSQETLGGDLWYDLEPVSPTTAAQILGPTYTDSSGKYVVVPQLQTTPTCL